MIEKTRGIILQQIRYGENSRIVQVYTERFGRLAFMVKGLGKKSGVQRALLQPLALLELEISYKPSRNLQNIREARISVPLPDIHMQIYKASIALFISEVLSKTLTEEDTNSPLFRFLYNSVIQLDREQEITNIFHLLFLARLTQYLGFPPVNRFSGENRYFDLREGLFVPSLPTHPDFMDTENAALFSSLLDPGDKLQDFSRRTLSDKKEFLEKILLYYRIHLEGMGKIKSLDILHEVFH
jgi:DNA repair protein RecO (recombination protein O)